VVEVELFTGTVLLGIGTALLYGMFILLGKYGDRVSAKKDPDGNPNICRKPHDYL
jgi:hypothetical protein